MRRILSVGIAVVTLALTVVAAPALADETTSSDVKPDKVAAIAPFDLPEVDHVVALHCRGDVTDRGPVVGCEWRAAEQLDIAGWQLWRLQIRPEHDGRTLVAELGADAAGYTDATVTAPAAYLYVVLGLNRAGEVIARSRPDLARVVERPPAGIALACELQRTTSDAPALTETSDVVEPGYAPAIGCRWERSDHADVRGYVVNRVVDGGRRTVVAEVGADTTSIVDYRVEFGHRYTYMVSALDGEGNVVAHSRAVTVGVPPWRYDWVTDRPTDRIPERDTDHESDRPTDRIPERDTGHVTDQPTDRIPDPVPDVNTDKGTDSASDSAVENIDRDRVVDAIADRESDLQRPADRLPTDH